MKRPCTRPQPVSRLVLAMALCGACKPAEDCAMTSALDAFEPLCSGEMIQYVGETRVFINGLGGTMTAFLPESVAPGTYGGTSGQPLTIILDLSAGDELLADDRLSSITFARVDEDEAELRLVADFDGQAVKGPLIVPIISATEDGV